MLGDSLRRRHTRPAATKDDGADSGRRSRSDGGLTWVHWAGAAVFVLLVSFGVGYLISTVILFPRPEDAGTGVPVPALVGDDRAEAEAKLRTAGLELAGIETLPGEAGDSGRVLGQDPLPGQELRAGGAVRLAISTGPARVHVPDVAGLSGPTAAELLTGMGLEVRTVPAEGGAAGPGLAVATEPAAGTAVERSASVTLQVTRGTAGVSTPGDTTAGAGATDPLNPVDAQGPPAAAGDTLGGPAAP